MKKLFESWRTFVEQEDKEEKDIPWSEDPEAEEGYKFHTRDVPLGSPTPKKDSKIKMSDYGYVFGTIDGEIIDAHNHNKPFYGASSPKPILALANLIKCNVSPESGRCLSGDELRALLNYSPEPGAKNLWHGGDSNAVNKALARAQSWQKGVTKKIRSVGAELASFNSDEEVNSFLQKMGLPNMKIRYGGVHNQQTPLNYYNFFRLLLDPNLQMMAGTSSAAHEILNYMQRRHGVLKQDREHTGRFLEHLKYLKEKGLAVKSIYGKGGYYKQANNSAMVIDDKYILIVYTGSRAAIKRSKGKRVSDLTELIYQILAESGVYGTISEAKLFEGWRRWAFGAEHEDISKPEIMQLHDRATQLARSAGWPCEEQTDAHRHILASAMFTQKYGEHFTRFAGGANELKGIIFKTYNKKIGTSGLKMDLVNNEIGINLGLDSEPADDFSLSRMVKKIIVKGHFFVHDGKTLWRDYEHKCKKFKTDFYDYKTKKYPVDSEYL